MIERRETLDLNWFNLKEIYLLVNEAHEEHADVTGGTC